MYHSMHRFFAHKPQNECKFSHSQTRVSDLRYKNKLNAQHSFLNKHVEFLDIWANFEELAERLEEYFLSLMCLKSKGNQTDN